MAERERHDCVVVGAGPAGLGAAIEAGRAGVDTCVIDMRPRPTRRGRHTPRPELRRLAGAALAAGAELRYATAVWGIWGHDLATYPAGGCTQRLQARQIVLATGARPRAVVFPGWTLPGVMTVASAEALLDDGAPPAGRVVLAGTGPHLLATAVDLLGCGLDLRVVVQAEARLADPATARLLRRRGVAVRARGLVVRAEGERSVERVAIARVDASWRPLPGTETLVEADRLVLSYGLVPANELARLSGCAHDDIPHRGGLVPARDAWLGTSQTGVFVAGGAGGIVGPAAAVEEGRLAGIGAALRLGRLSLAQAEVRARRVRARLQRRSGEAAGPVAGCSAGPGLDELATPETVVCRCEGVTAAEISAAVMPGSLDPSGVRAETRAGMGECQARWCGRQIRLLVARANGVALRAVPELSVRPPIVPIPLGSLTGRPAGIDEETRARA